MADVEFQDFIDEVIDKNDILDIISEYTKPKRVGTRYAALCPLHNDKKSPSLSISPDKQVFHCFGCGAGGNVIHFIMEAEHLDFMDAVKYLAERAKIEIPEFGKSSIAHQKNFAEKKDMIYNINAEAGRYFFNCLTSEVGKDALAYLKNRELKNSTIKQFGLGYAPEGWDKLINHLKQKGYTEQNMFEAGLVKKRENGSYYDSFYDGRAIIPIINVQGNIIGFGGRIMVKNDNVGKYLNTSETLVFKKKENLFGLNFAKNNNSGVILLMEGYMDVISLHQAGITNAVASLGTAFTEEQAKLLKRYTDKVVLCYDSDEAGKKATLRAGKILTDAGLKAKVLTISEGKDPDEYIRLKGGDMFRVLIENAKPLIEYRIDEIYSEYENYINDSNEFVSPDIAFEFTERAASVIAEIKNPIEYELYAKRVSKNTGITIDALNSVVKNLRSKIMSQEEKQDIIRERRLRRQHEVKSDVELKLFNAEELLLNLLLDSNVYKIVKEKNINEDSFSDSFHKEIAKVIFAQYAKTNSVKISDIFDAFEESLRGRVARLLLDDKNIHNTQKACIQPINTILENTQKSTQNDLLESGDLENLDKVLKDMAKKKK